MRHMKKVAAISVATAALGSYYYVKKEHPDLFNNISSYTPLPRNDQNGKRSTAIFQSGYEDAIRKSQVIVKRIQSELGVPGIVIGVSVNGQKIWMQGFGMANVETQTRCLPDTKMRIASISKPITIGLLASLMEKGVVDIDRPIQDYVPYFPRKSFKGNIVEITTRMLASHTAGIRHYKKSGDSEWDDGAEFYIKDRFKEVKQSVDLFKDDDLLFEPGKGFEYTTHGYTLLSAVIEGAAKEPFAKQLKTYLKVLGLKNTHLDEVPTIVYGRANYYARNKEGRLNNAELTDNSYKWAGGGLVSTVGDLLDFANIMLYSFHRGSYLQKKTVRELWSGVEGTKMSWGVQAKYGLGWTVVPELEDYQGEIGQRFHVGHGGGAVGASSVLIIIPGSEGDAGAAGVAVAVIGNLQNCSFYAAGKEIADCFAESTKKTAVAA